MHKSGLGVWVLVHSLYASLYTAIPTPSSCDFGTSIPTILQNVLVYHFAQYQTLHTHLHMDTLPFSFDFQILSSNYNSRTRR